MMPDGKIKNSGELEFVVFCIENIAARLDVDSKRVYQAFTLRFPAFIKRIPGNDAVFPTAFELAAPHRCLLIYQYKKFI